MIKYLCFLLTLCFIQTFSLYADDNQRVEFIRKSPLTEYFRIPDDAISFDEIEKETGAIIELRYYQEEFDSASEVYTYNYPNTLNDESGTLEIENAFMGLPKYAPNRKFVVSCISDDISFRIMVRSHNENTNELEVIADQLFSDNSILEIPINAGYVYYISYYIHIENENDGNPNSQDPLITYKYQTTYIKTGLFSGPIIYSMNNPGKTLGWTNGIYATYSNSTMRNRLFMPSLLLFNNMYIDENNENENVYDSILNIGVGISWLNGLTLGLNYRMFANENELDYFIGVDLVQIFNTFL